MMVGDSLLNIENNEKDHYESNIELHPIAKNLIEIIKKFNNQKVVLDMAKDLLEIERMVPSALENAAGFIRGMRQGLAISNKIPDEIA